MQKTVPKLDIGVSHSVFETFEKYGDVNFRHMLAVGQHLFFFSNLQLVIQSHHKTKVIIENLYTSKCITQEGV